MSSLLTSYSQIPGRIRFLVALGTTAHYVPNTSDSFNSIMNATAFTAAVSTTSGAVYTLYRDLGKQVMLVDTSGRHQQLMRLVQRVRGNDTEGVPDDYEGADRFYIRVWADDPAANPVTVSRTG
jgi:hypothetical protein